jgi:hypothetical protein
VRGLSLIIWLIIVAALYPFLATGWQALKEYYHFYELQSQVHQLVKIASSLSEEETKARLREILLDIRSQLRPEDFELNHSKNQVQIKVSWQTDLKFNFYNQYLTKKTLIFRIDEQYP